MDTSETPGAPVGPAAPSATSVAVSTPADLARLPVLRSIAATLAVSLDLDIDAIADLRLAVDELATAVISRARPGSRVATEFVADDGAVHVTCAAPATSMQPVDEHSFGWTVLTTLADSVTAAVTRGDDGEPHVRMTLTMARHHPE